MGTLSDVISLLRAQIRGDHYQHKPLRLGMVVDVDPTPFLRLDKPLATGPATDVVTKTTVLTVVGTGIVLHRIYFTPDEFIQMSFSGDEIKDARFFGLLAEVIPADSDEWKVWVDKDGLLYGDELRWDAADATFTRHLPPFEATERGEESITTILASLFVRNNGIPEYLMACNERHGDERPIRVYVGVDLNTSTI